MPALRFVLVPLGIARTEDFAVCRRAVMHVLGSIQHD